MHKGRILLVDNEEDVVQTLTRAFHDEGFAVAQARDGEQALNLIHRETPDLVLLDIWLPGMDGIETLQVLKEQHAEIEVIVMSGHGNIETAVKATKLGAFDYYEKPLSLDCLMPAVKQALHRRKQGSAQLSQQWDWHEAPLLIGDSAQMSAMRFQLERAWQCDTPVLIQGEEGSGKALIARLLHNGSDRREGPFVRCKCVNLTPYNAERMLFGGIGIPDDWRQSPSKGYLELANGGTLFLDEVDYLPMEIQEKLCRAIKTWTITRVGGKIPIPLNTRILASCTTTPHTSQARRELIPALAEYLQPLHLEVPPLRDHKADIPALTQYFLRLSCSTSPRAIDDEAMATLIRYHWPGNIQELKKTLEQMVRNATGNCLGVWDIPSVIRHAEGSVPSASLGNSPAVNRIKCQQGPHARQPYREPYHANQRTLLRSVVICGQGLQSGQKTGMILSPLPPHSGIIFCNITSGETLPASIAFVESTDFCTSLRRGPIAARTIEHIMSVLHAYRISNLLIKISGEIPIMDGSAADFCHLIEEGGIHEQEMAMDEFVVDRCYHVGDVKPEAKHILIEPYDGFRVSYRLSYPKPLGIQEINYEHRDGATFQRDIAPARTFAFLRDVEAMHTLGLVAGGRFNNVILIDDEKIVNSVQLHFPDEFARHKVLDILGDFYLLGRPLRGHIRANMTGHTENIALVQKLHAAMRTAQP